MELSIRINVRYVAPPNSYIRDMLELFRSPSWVSFIIRYITPQLNNVAPTATFVLENLDKLQVICNDEFVSNNNNNNINTIQDNISSCVICMEPNDILCTKLPCGHQFHKDCVAPWLQNHSTCPTCRHQLPTDVGTIFSVRSINTTIILQQSQANIPTEELMNLSASNQTIRAVVNARVRRNVSIDSSGNLPIRSSSTSNSILTNTTDRSNASTMTNNPEFRSVPSLLVAPDLVSNENHNNTNTDFGHTFNRSRRNLRSPRPLVSRMISPVPHRRNPSFTAIPDVLSIPSSSSTIPSNIFSTTNHINENISNNTITPTTINNNDNNNSNNINHLNSPRNHIPLITRNSRRIHVRNNVNRNNNNNNTILDSIASRTRSCTSRNKGKKRPNYLNEDNKEDKDNDPNQLISQLIETVDNSSTSSRINSSYNSPIHNNDKIERPSSKKVRFNIPSNHVHAD